MTVGPGILFVGNDNGTLSALSMTNGVPVWTSPVAQPEGRSELERMADVDGLAVLDGTTLFATSYKNHTVAIDGPTGQVLWDRDNGGPGGLAVSNSAVVVTDAAGKVWGLDKNTGGSLWQQPGLGLRSVSAPAVLGDYAVVGDFEGVLHWLRLVDGEFAARANLAGPISGQPAVADGVLVVQTRSGQLAAFRSSKPVPARARAGQFRGPASLPGRLVVKFPLVSRIGASCAKVEHASPGGPGRASQFGKSTLFNALTRTRDALVHDEPA